MREDPNPQVPQAPGQPATRPGGAQPIPPTTAPQTASAATETEDQPQPDAGVPRLSRATPGVPPAVTGPVPADAQVTDVDGNAIDPATMSHEPIFGRPLSRGDTLAGPEVDNARVSIATARTQVQRALNISARVVAIRQDDGTTAAFEDARAQLTEGIAKLQGLFA